LPTTIVARYGAIGADVRQVQVVKPGRDEACLPCSTPFESADSAVGALILMV